MASPIFESTGHRYYESRILDVEYDGAEGFGLWFTVYPEDDDGMSIGLSQEQTEKFIDWVHENFPLPE